MSEITTEILVRFFEGRTTQEENDAIACWIENDPDNQEIFNRELSLHLMYLELFAEAADDTSASVSSDLRKSRRSRLAVYSGIAAALLTGAFLTWFTAVRPFEDDARRLMSFNTEAGQRASVTLPDGTVVELNSGSTLEYPAVFSKNERRVRVEGEAMFDVAKDADRPFFVETFAYDVKVLGTRFNVLAEEETGEFCTALIEGSVAILDKNDDAVAELKPDQAAMLVDGRLQKIQSENIGSQYRWTDGIINCSGLTFGQVVMKFEKAFGVEIHIERDVMPDNKIRYMKVYVSDGPAAALELLKEVVDFEYSYDYRTNTYLIR